MVKRVVAGEPRLIANWDGPARAPHEAGSPVPTSSRGNLSSHFMIQRHESSLTDIPRQAKRKSLMSNLTAVPYGESLGTTAYSRLHPIYAQVDSGITILGAGLCLRRR